MSAEAKLIELKLVLPPAPKAMGVYKSIVVVDKLVYTSGHGPLKADGTLITGYVGTQLTIDEGYMAARQTGLAILASLKAQFGSLDKIARVVKIFGMVQCGHDFKDHPKVINGCSELFRDVWGSDVGVGARSAVGMGSLPASIAVEIEAVFELV
jgi:enamine deaminase RidA (YjgF/YER057c/UK114 family)